MVDLNIWKPSRDTDLPQRIRNTAMNRVVEYGGSLSEVRNRNDIDRPSQNAEWNTSTLACRALQATPSGIRWCQVRTTK